MSDAFHSKLVAEARADGAALHELGEHIGTLHRGLGHTRAADLTEVRREFEVVHEEFEALHQQDMQHHLDQDAHRSWRARVKRLAAQVDGLTNPTTR